MKFTNLIWRDSQPYSEIFDDIYYSSNGSEGKKENIAGESEFQHVFFKHNGLPERWQDRDDFVIAELGFGSGLNFLLTVREWLKHCATSNRNKTLHYIAIEKHPLSPEAIVELFSRYPDLKPLYEELVDNYPPAVETTHIRRLFDNRVVVHFKFMDVLDALKNNRLNVDAWFLDGFSPAKNPDMWSQKLFESIANNSRNDTSCSTYTAAGFVKRNLKQAGFVVRKVSGYGKKREMLVAEFPGEKICDDRRFSFKDKPWLELPVKITPSKKEATIIGAGIAGLSLAHALVQRDWKVVIIDKDGGIQKQASSNPAPIIYPRLSINNDVDTEFFIEAYCHALHVFKILQKKTEQRFWFDDGLLQLMNEERIKKIIDKFKFNKNFISIVSEFENSELVQTHGEQVIVNYASAGVVLPAILCDALRQACGDSLEIIDAEITRIDRNKKTWQCFSGSQISKETEVLIIANGTEINNLDLRLKLPIEIIRGQVVVFTETEKSQQIKKTLNADVHITPAIYGKHYLGASYVKNSRCLKIDQNENRALLNSLDEIYRGVFEENDCDGSWLGFRTVSKDRVPIVGAVPDEMFFNKEYADIKHGGTKKKYLSANYLEGLYVSAAHGSRGFTSSFLSAEIITAQLTGEPSPVNKRVSDYLSPSRFIVNDLKRR